MYVASSAGISVTSVMGEGLRSRPQFGPRLYQSPNTEATELPSEEAS